MRLSFCLKIPTVCAFLGSTVTSECILPFLENALADCEEMVVAQSLRCITTLMQLLLLSRLMLVDVVKSACPLLLHPRHAIRQAALSLMQAAGCVLGPTDTAVFLLPLLRPALTFSLTGEDLRHHITVTPSHCHPVSLSPRLTLTPSHCHPVTAVTSTRSLHLQCSDQF